MSVKGLDRPLDSFSFERGDVVYVIDKNGVDLWRGYVMNVSSAGYMVMIDDDDTLERVTRSRVVGLTDANNSLFSEQVRLRAELPPACNDEYTSIPASQALTQGRRHAATRIKRPIIDNVEVARNAWAGGIRTAAKFRAAMSKAIDGATDVFERYRKVRDIMAEPLFRIGGLEPENVGQFWTRTRLLWRKMFGDVMEVETKWFVKKAAELMKLQKQKGSNARATLEWFFVEETLEKVDFTRFAAFLAMFGPHETAIRKVGHFLKCPIELRDAVTYIDLDNIDGGNTDGEEDDDEDIAEMNANEFAVNLGGCEKIVFNNPQVRTGANYLIDAEGKEYESWIAFFEAHELDGSAIQIEDIVVE